MVNVTKSNFLTQLADFLHHLPTSSYVAIDEEMTGISLPSSDDGRPNKVELPAERYVRCLKAVPERYSILQVGVALFHRNPNYPQVKEVEEEEEEARRGRDRVGPGLGLGRDGGEEDGEDDEHAYMHREGMLNQDELEDLTEREEEEVGEDDDAAAVEGKEGQTEYTSRVYNFYLFPHAGGGGSRQQGREMTMNPSTVKFLLENQMDFDKVFREGVPYATVEEASYLKGRYFEKYNAGNKADDNNATAPEASPTTAPRSGRNRVTLTRVEDIAFVARAMAGLREWIDSDGASAADGNDNGGNGGGAVGPGGDGGDASGGGDVHDGTSRREEGASLVLPPCNAYLRRCLYETIEDEYPGLVLERADSTSEGGGATASALATARNQIRAIRLSPAEKERREARLRREAWDGVLAELGFATVFRALSDACNGRTFEEGRTRDYLDGLCPDLTCCPPAIPTATGRRIPIVVHNGLHDLMFLMTHCHDPALPDSFEDTKTIIRTYFPLVFDTKVIGTEYSDAIIRGGSTILGDLFATTCGDGREPPSDGAAGVSPTIGLPASITNQDGRGQGQAHEAAYDAYMTGCVFGALCNRILESKNNLSDDLTLDGLLHDSEGLLREWVGLNLIYMHVSLFTIDLESSLGPVVGLHDPLSSGLSIDTTFHVSGITASVSTRDILRALWTGNEGEDEVIRQLKYEIIWVDDSSFFVGTRLADDGISSAYDDPSTTGLIASHVRNKLYGGLGSKVEISSIGDYFTKKNRVIDTTDSAGIVSSLVSVAKKPFLGLQSKLTKILGFGEKRSSEDSGGNGRENKRMRLS